ncbi:hypothetical protein AB6A40_004075 [Gnathostoma spinigerum]|uniref:WD repeat-containing protein 74 n=1 Tax=Gnathostoma spinigerum TaxID=75299 RepID=A0ABD6EIY8_9BILA
MDCYVGASTGAFKGLNFSDSSFMNFTAISTLKPKEDEITYMTWADDSEAEILVSQMNRQLKLYDSNTSTFSNMFSIDGGTGAVKGVYADRSSNIVSAVESGDLNVWSKSGDCVKTLNAGSDLVVMVPNRGQDGQCATGGNENPLKVWDLEKGEKVFIAKNVPPDSLQLRVPVWETAISFLPDSSNIVTATKKSQIRVYDPRAQRRPVKQLEWLDEPLTSLSLCSKPMRVIVGNTRGEMGQFDLRNKIMLVNKFKGGAGSIRGIYAPLALPYVASCSIDRFVRLYEIDTKKLVKKVYCKARLNRILVRSSLSFLNETKLKEELEDFEDDWEKINAKGSVLSESADEDSETSSSGGSGGSEWKDVEIIHRNQAKVKEKNESTPGNVTQKKRKIVRGRKRESHLDGGEMNGSEVKEITGEQRKKRRKAKSLKHRLPSPSNGEIEVKRKLSKKLLQ